MFEVSHYDGCRSRAAQHQMCPAGRWGGSDCILHDICTLYEHQSMHSMHGRDHHYYYTPHSAAIRCDGVTADGNVCIDTWYTEVNLDVMFVQSTIYVILGIFTAAASSEIRVCLSCSCQNPMVRCSQVPKLGYSVVYKINTLTLLSVLWFSAFGSGQ